MMHPDDIEKLFRIVQVSVIAMICILSFKLGSAVFHMVMETQ